MASFTDRFIDWAAKLKSSLGPTEDGDPALRDLNHAILLRPDEAEAYCHRALAYVDLDQHRQAIRDAERAIELRPDESTGYFARGVAKTSLGEYKEAIRDLDRAIQLQPDLAEA